MKEYKDFFKNKKITVMGLGLLGRGVGDVAFLAECGAELIVTDLKSALELKESLEKLKKYKNICFVLGEHRLEDFRKRDMVLKAAGVPFDSPYIAEAKKNNIPVEMSASLFARLSPATIVGITGTRGKSTVTHLLHEILRAAHRGSKKRVFLGGNVRGVATLPFLKSAKKGDIAVLELDSWQLQGFGESKLSPHVSVVTTFMADHLNYYRGDIQKYFEDKANIFEYHTKNDILVLGKDVEPIIQKRYKKLIKSTTLVANVSRIPRTWKIRIPGEHNRYNVSIAIEAARVLGVKKTVLQKAVESFKGVPGRLELVRICKGIRVYNDTTATTPDAVMVALRAVKETTQSTVGSFGTVLIMGGADKQLEMSELVAMLPDYTKAVVVLPGTGTERIRKELELITKVPVTFTSSLREAMQKALNFCSKGDVLLLSPGFASFGLFKNEFDRGEQFIKEVKNI